MPLLRKMTYKDKASYDSTPPSSAQHYVYFPCSWDVCIHLHIFFICIWCICVYHICMYIHIHSPFLLHKLTCPLPLFLYVCIHIYTLIFKCIYVYLVYACVLIQLAASAKQCADFPRLTWDCLLFFFSFLVWQATCTSHAWREVGGWGRVPFSRI